MKKKTPPHNYDSDEEWYFSWYADELYEAGYIEFYASQPNYYILSHSEIYSYDQQLKTKLKTVAKKLINQHIYTPDFQIMWNEKARGVFFNHIADNVDLTNIPFVTSKPFCLIEIKPAFSLHNSQREFAINAKWMYQKYGIFIQKVIISNKIGLFKNTFTPTKYLKTDKSGKDRKLFYKPRSLEEFVKLRA